MGDTLDSILAGEAPTLTFIVEIEGYQYLLTSGSASAAVTAWSGTDWSSALSGLEINWGLSQHMDPWMAFTPGFSIELKVMDCDGTDRFGIDVHRREGGTSSKIAATVDVDDTTITVLRADDFAASGTAYLGTEAFAYSARDTGTDAITVSTRGKWSPGTREGGGRFSRSHHLEQVVSGVPPIATAATTVRSHPTEWAGKWVHVYISANRGGVLDTKAEAHLAFAGRIAGNDKSAIIRDTPEGITMVSCDDVRQTLKDTVILRRQFKARVKEGLQLFAGGQFEFHARRRTAAGAQTQYDADHLVVVASGATAPYEINEGYFTAGEFTSAINDWLAQAKTDGDSPYQITYSYATATDEGFRPSWRMEDEDATAATRTAFMNTGGTAALEVRRALGWDETLGFDGGMTAINTTDSTATSYGVAAPVRVNAGWVRYDTTASIQLEAAEGEFVNQVAFLNPTIQGAGFGRGVIRIGDDVFACDVPSITDGEGTVNIRRVRELDTALGAKANKLLLTMDDAGDLNVTQVLLLEGLPITLVMALLTSTGVASFNSTLYDLLPSQCSAGIPWSLLGQDFEAELSAATESAVPMTIIVETPTQLIELLNVSFILRNLHIIWHRGRLALRGWATPTSEATLTLTDDDKAAPIAAAGHDSQRAIAEYSDKWWKNSIRIRHNRSIFGGEYRDTANLAGVEGGAGARRVTLDARNAVRGAGFLTGEDVDAILPHFVGALPFLTVPVLIVRVPVNYTKFETLTPGVTLLFTDDHPRDPTTGERGVAAKPALVVGQSYSWGGSTIGENGGPVVKEPHGSVDLMLFPQMSLAPYSPTMEVDWTAGNGGYDSGTSTITVTSHSHSEASDATDLSRFAVNDVITIVQQDPSDPAAPLTWNRTIATIPGLNTFTFSGGTLTAWDSALRYRVHSQNYSAAVTSQRTKVFQADGPPGDGMIANLREAYGYTHGIQTTSGTVIAATVLGRRHVDLSFGDGAALTSGAAYDSAVNLNNLINYGTSPQQPQIYSEPATWTGPTGTYEMVKVCWRALGIQLLNASTRKLWVAPRFKSSDGASATVRISLCRNQPKSADPSAPSRMDVNLGTGPYVSVSFTTTSPSYVIPSPDDLDISHLRLDDTLLGGGGWLITEITAKAVFDGLPENWLGPQMTP